MNKRTCDILEKEIKVAAYMGRSFVPLYYGEYYGGYLTEEMKKWVKEHNSDLEKEVVKELLRRHIHYRPLHLDDKYSVIVCVCTGFLRFLMNYFDGHLHHKEYGKYRQNIMYKGSRYYT